jgi:hypothetical protein
MANLVITSTTNKINVVFNDLATTAGIKKGTWHKERITFRLMNSDSFVNVLVINEPAWSVSFNGSTGTLQIDSIDGVAPTSNSDLYDKLTALI